jgi:CO dehydrogenase nickel-insertion accessory protein CooC1
METTEALMETAEALMNDVGQGKIVTFYSYKGGTGRTMALANIAWILASNGKRVLAVDWDLESPGLHKFFHPFLDQAVVDDTPGVIEIINDYATAATARGPRPDNWHVEYTRVVRHAVSLQWDKFPGGGTLDLLSAGRQNRDYSAAICSLDWDNFYDRLGGARFFRAMRADMKENYDYVLIDSRTGLSDVADICTVELPDVLVVCFTLNNQGIDGAASVAQQIQQRYRNKNIRILPVPMRIEDGEKEKLDVGRALARSRFEGFPKGVGEEGAARYWGSVEVPYKPFYAFEETLATFGDDPASPATMLAAYERITDAITAGGVSGMPALPEDLRTRYRDAYVRRQPITSTEVFLSYAPEDQRWAEWIEAVLTKAGFHVLAYRTVGFEDAPPEGLGPEQVLQRASRAVAVMSPTYVRSPEAKAIWTAMTASDHSGARRQVVPLRIAEGRFPPPFTDRPAVDLTQRDPDEVTAALLRAFDRPVPLPQPSAATGEQTRYPWTVPSITNVPTRNLDFTGRDGSLQRMRDTLTGSGVAVVLAQALYGLGGVGKTQVALEYAHRFKADYDLIWWVPSEQTDEVTVALAELADRLGLPVGDNQGEAAAAALEVLHHYSGRWLLVFDNADDPKDLEPFLPTGIGHVIITSRNQAWTHSSRTQAGLQAGETLEVNVFLRQESITRLMRHLPELTAVDADKVAESLGDLPLAIEQASAWLEQTGMPASTYVEQLSEHRTLIEALKQPPTDYPVPVVVTWSMSLKRLQDRSPAAVRLLRLCAFFSPGPISNVLLYSDEMMQVLLPYDPRLSEKLIFGRVIRDISRFALVRVDQGSNSIQMHRLVQAVIRSDMTDGEVEEACHDVHKVLVGARPRQGDTDDPENWARYTMIWPHLVPSRAEDCTEPPTRQLLIDWVRYLWKNGEFEQCLSLGRRLENLWAQQLGADHTQTLLLRFHIANVLRSMGRFGEARELDVDVLERQRRVLEPDHPHLLMTAGGLAADLRALGEFDQALARDKETYDRFKDQFGADHPRTLAAANNLAVSLRLVGDCFAAHALDEDTLTRREEVLGPEHPYTLFSSANLARDLREEGSFQDSVTMLRGTYARYQVVLGDHMLDTLRTAKSLAVSLRKAGAQEEARDLTLATYDRYLRHYSADSPDALACALNLACDHSALNDKRLACQLVTKVGASYRATLGDDHPYTLVAANNLVTYLRGTGELTEARQLGEQTLERMRAKLGDTHPFTLSCAVNLANTMGDMEDLGPAEALERETLAKLRERFGDDHPDTLVCEANLATTLHMTGREAEADEVKERIMVKLTQILGPNHPNIVGLREWQRINRDLEPQPI